MNKLWVFSVLLIICLPSEAQIPLYDGKKRITLDDGTKIVRTQDLNEEIRGFYAKRVRKCPPFCITPMVLDGVGTIGEIELLNFIEDKKGIVIDARGESWVHRGIIPTALSLPHTTLAKAPFNGSVGATAIGLSVSDQEIVLDNSDSPFIVVYCNGAWCGQSLMLIKRLIEIGYPKNKIFWYRGGMQAWITLGFNSVQSINNSLPEQCSAGGDL